MIIFVKVTEVTCAVIYKNLLHTVSDTPYLFNAEEKREMYRAFLNMLITDPKISVGYDFEKKFKETKSKLIKNMKVGKIKKSSSIKQLFKQSYVYFWLPLKYPLLTI